MPEGPILEIKGLCKSFPGLDHRALEPVDAVVQPGCIVGLVGPDGAGKTTLLRLAAGLLTPEAGSVRILGQDPLKDAAEARELTGYMPQKFGLYEDLTVIENLNLYADLRGLTGTAREERFETVLRFSDLKPFTGRRAGALSGGMKQKLGLACALLSRPKLLLLDEPSVGVDPVSRRELWRMVHELVQEGMGVVWSTAYLDEAELCHQVVLLSGGRMLYSGPPRDLAERVRDRCFRISGITTGRRRLLTSLLDREEVVDGVIEGADLRIVLKEAGNKSMLDSEAGKLSGSVHPVDPRFEDAFVDLLGGAPPGTSALADKIEQKQHAEDAQVVEARDLTKRFGDFTATREVSFGVRAGEIFGLLGPNGAGKSTTFKMMCGLLKPSSGEALVSGTSLSHAPGAARQKVGYMAQKFSLYGMLNARQNLEFFSGVYGLRGKDRRNRVDEMIHLFGLADYLGQSSEKLPLGIKQRLALACSVMHTPDILFLDEPTSGVDPVTRREFWSHINGLVRKGVTIMVTTHFMDEAEYCDRIGLMFRGEMIAIDTPHALKESVTSPELEQPTLEDAFIELIQRWRERKEVA